MITHQKSLSTTVISKVHQRLLLTCSLVVVFTLVTAAAVFFYVKNEHAIHYWDYASYHDMTLAKAVYLRDLPVTSGDAVLRALKEIWSSTRRDYSDYHTLPVVPFVLIFGDSRLVYILSIALIYFVPFALVTAAIAARVIPAQSRLVFWSAALATMLIPVAWLPTVRGYPDTGAAALIGLAILMYLRDPKLSRSWQIGLIGFCIGAAILFRRHFIYDGIAFFFAITAQATTIFFSELRRNTKNALHGLISSVTRIALTGVCTVITLGILGWPFINRVISTNFGLLYASYEVPFDQNLRYYTAHYGIVICLMAVAGIIIAVKTDVIRRQFTVFIISFFVFSVLQWMLMVQQLGIHYTLHFTLWIILGVVAFGWSAWSRLKGSTRRLVLSACGGYLMLNIALGLAPVGLFKNTSIALADPTAGTGILFSQHFAPQQREDYAEIVRLVHYLRDVSSDEAPIYVAASSGTLNDDLLWHAERTLFEDVISYSYQEFWQNKQLNVLQWVPFADSRDYYPLEKLLKSEYVVVATPFQHHMQEREQDVVKVVFDIFTDNWDFSHDFKRLPQQFYLADGVVVDVYQRVNPTSLSTAIRTLKDMQDYIGVRPGGQLSWISLSSTSEYRITRNRDNTYNIEGIAHDQAPISSRAFLYLDELPDEVIVSGELYDHDMQCGDVLLSLAAINAQGHIHQMTEVPYLPTETSHFSLSVPTRHASYLLLSFSGTNGPTHGSGSCSVLAHSVTVSAR